MIIRNDPKLITQGLNRRYAIYEEKRNWEFCARLYQYFLKNFQ